ncbi:MAG: hypothetical protein EXS00_04670 [Phycisphaerales bacterium]|nr:hypothetical protein [Phycisphaerales bacterium]
MQYRAHSVMVSAAILIGSNSVSAVAEKCPELMEIPCGATTTIPTASGELVFNCECGPGAWVTEVFPSHISPTPPLEESVVGHKIGPTEWNWQIYAWADEMCAHTSVTLGGRSHWLGAGSQTQFASAHYDTRRGESWRGKRPACPRIVMLLASGGAVINIGVSCSAHFGCSASASACASGYCRSLGDASAMISDLCVSGEVNYNAARSNFEVGGDLGPLVPFGSNSVSGSISASSGWSTTGTGAATGMALVSVNPDRCYCAFTNRPYRLSAGGTVSAAVAGTVDDDGSIAAHAAAEIFLGVG